MKGVQCILLLSLLCGAVEGLSVSARLELAPRENTPITWCKYDNTCFGGGHPHKPPTFDTLEEAQKACLASTDCGGITKTARSYILRSAKHHLHVSRSHETAWKTCIKVKTGETLKKPQNDIEYHFEGKLKPGDIVEVEAAYNEGAKQFNIYEVKPPGMHHGGFEVTIEDQLGHEVVWMRARAGHNKYTNIPWAKPFKIQIVLMDETYKLFVNTVNCGIHKYGYPLSTSQFVKLRKAKDSFVWKAIRMPGRSPSDIYTHRDDLQDPVEKLKTKLSKNIIGKTVAEVKAYADSTEGSIDILKHNLLSQLHEQEDFLDLSDETVVWILNNRNALETLMTSGGKFRKQEETLSTSIIPPGKEIRHGNTVKYPAINKEAVMTMVRLIKKDPSIKKDPTMLRWAVAISLSPRFVESFAASVLHVSSFEMYFNFKKWLKEGILFPLVREISAWHLKYVLPVRFFKQEMEWAHENVPEGKKSEKSIHGAVYKLMHYRMRNADNISVFDDANYYYHKPRTLKQMHIVGGVCGAISTFATGMCRAFGVPATTAPQNGHCAFVWYNHQKDRWQQDNAVDPWYRTRMHGGWFPTGYFGYCYAAAYLPLMNEAQGKNNKGFRLSEKMRLASKIADPDTMAFPILNEAIQVGPQNFYAWADLNASSYTISQNKRESVLQDTLLTPLLIEMKARAIPRDVALRKPCQSEQYDHTERISSGEKGGKPCTSEQYDHTEGAAYCKLKKCTFEIDLQGTYQKFSEAKFQWWEYCSPKTIKIFAADEAGKFNLVKTEADIVKQDKEGTENAWAILSGWDSATTKVRVEMFNDKIKDKRHKRYIAVKHFQLIGIPKLEHTEVLNESTPHLSKTKSSFDIDLKDISILTAIHFKWGHGAKPKSVSVYVKVGTGSYKKISKTGPQDMLTVKKEPASKIRVEFTGYPGGLTVKVKVVGGRYNTREILEMELERTLPDPKGTLRYAKKLIKDEIIGHVCTG